MSERAQWHEIETLFHEALALPVEQRIALLATANESLRAEVESLLESDGAGNLGDLPAHLAADLLDSQPGALAPGERVGQYEVESLVSIGGMGEVYLARDRLGQPVALKILRRHLLRNSQSADRFEIEARAASALHHPHIVTVYESGESPCGLFIAMEWLDGNTLRDRINSGVVSVADALDWGGQAAGALDAAHSAGILHRDVKPENMIICKNRIVKILDFGLARLAGPLRSEPHSTGSSGTISGTLSGTLLYMSPEVLRGETASNASDVFSLGALIYELAAGRHPFAGETPLDVFEAIECRSPEPPSRLRSGIAPEIDALVLAMLDRDPSKRPGARHACEALNRASTKP